uniref:Uncharacterized protein n=1 Tax=Arundo donax TaxID=35708 RepID=A0A0A9DEE0_ARUDO
MGRAPSTTMVNVYMVACMKRTTTWLFRETMQRPTTLGILNLATTAASVSCCIEHIPAYFNYINEEKRRHKKSHMKPNILHIVYQIMESKTFYISVHLL